MLSKRGIPLFLRGNFFISTGDFSRLSAPWKPRFRKEGRPRSAKRTPEKMELHDALTLRQKDFPGDMGVFLRNFSKYLGRKVLNFRRRYRRIRPSGGAKNLGRAASWEGEPILRAAYHQGTWK